MKRLVLLAFIWGWSFLFIKVAVGGMTPTTVAATRIALGAAVLLTVMRLRRLRLPRDLATWRHLTFVAVFGSALPFTMLAWGEERITSALTSVLNASTPLFTALFGALLLSERLRRVQVAGLAVGLAGVAVAAGVGGSDVSGSSLAGSAAAAGAGACYGIGFTWMKRHLMGMPAEVAAAGQLLAGAAILAPLAVATTAAEGIDLAPHRLLAIGLLGAVGTGVAYVLNYRVVADLGATKASLVTYLIPVVAVAVGIVVLGEPFRLRILAGGVLVVAGIALVHRRLRLPGGRRRARRPPGPPVGAGTPLALVVAVAAVAVLAGCGDDGATEAADSRGGTSTTAASEASGGCDAAVDDPLDPSSSVHLLPGAPEPTYLTDPPTSGPHASRKPPTGVQQAPLDRPMQVKILEAGRVLIQHRGLDAHDQAALEALAGADVVVAPNPGLDEPVVATVWTKTMRCRGLDRGALEAFVAAHTGDGEDH